MKYLVNRETKEHRIAPAVVPPEFMGRWVIVQADAEGWIKWEGRECPLPDDVMCQIRNIFTVQSDLKSADEFYWSHVKAYRPILDKPELKPSSDAFNAKIKAEQERRALLQVGDLLDRLDAAREAAAQIPDILAELRERVGKHGYDLVARSPFVDGGAYESDMVSDPDGWKSPEPDMSDWRNWRAKDRVMCVSESKPFISGRVYEVTRGVDSDGFVMIEGYNVRDTRHSFRFHSRP